jgi:catechol 2,3-dioxygenase-like lactoylglutathione lyase family enzyme
MARIGNVTFACENPRALAEFWAAVLGYEVQPVEGEFADALVAHGVRQEDLDDECAAADPTGKGPRLYFQRKEKTRTATAPLHLDVAVGDRAAEVERFRTLGASMVETRTRSLGPFSETWTVMKDPEGNPFCVQESRP